MTITNPTFETNGEGRSTDAVKLPDINETAVTIAAMITGRPAETVHRWIETALKGNQILPHTIRWDAWVAYRAAVAMWSTILVTQGPKPTEADFEWAERALKEIDDEEAEQVK